MMNFKTFILLVSLLAPGTVFLSGCLDAPVMPKGSINGELYDNDGFLLRFSLVSMSDYPISQSTRIGNFSFDKTNTPYDIEAGYTNKGGAKYLNLHTPSCIIYNTNYESNNYLPVQITFPQWNHDNIILIKFISQEQFIQPFYKVEYFTDTVWHSFLYIPTDEVGTYGKFLYLEASSDDGKHVSSYIKYGIKEVAFFQSAKIDFTPQDIHNVRGQTSINFDINMQNITEDFSTDCYMTFNGMNKNSDLLLDGFWGINSGSFPVPMIAGMDYKYKIDNHYSNRQPYSGYDSQKWEYANPGETICFTQDLPITLVRPINGQLNIKDTSTFEISDPNEKGIYFYRIFTVNPDVALDVITDRTSVKFSDFKSRLMDFLPGSRYYWCITKFPKYTSIDDFVLVKFNEDYRYSSISCSSCNSFTTAP